MYVDLPRVRLDGGGRHFRRRWGYETATAAATLLEDIDEDAGHDAVDGVRAAICPALAAFDCRLASVSVVLRVSLYFFVLAPVRH